MKNHEKGRIPVFFTVMLLFLCSVILGGCGDRTEKEQASAPQAEESNGDAAISKEELHLYISLGDETYTAYPYEGEQTPEGLVAGIQELTGWNLSLADKITDGKGGMTVMFDQEACLFTGPPEEQKEEFHVYDATQLTLSVLDSVQETLQRWANPDNPDSVDVYFGMGADQPLKLENLDVTWPLDQPYVHSDMEALLEKR